MIYEMKGIFTGKFIIDELRKRSYIVRYFSASGKIDNKSVYRTKFIDDHLYYFFTESGHPTGAVINPEKEYEVNFMIGE